jgi:hypothetical protein
MFCQLAQAKSLREISDGLACCEGKLNHLGLQEGPKRSTLSYAGDASVIDLCLSMYNWATFRQTKGAVKLHLLLDHDGYLPRLRSLFLKRSFFFGARLCAKPS